MLGKQVPHGAPPHPRAQGNDIDVLARLFLLQIKEQGYADRMPKQPLACREPIKMHEPASRVHARHFYKGVASTTAAFLFLRTPGSSQLCGPRNMASNEIFRSGATIVVTVVLVTP